MEYFSDLFSSTCIGNLQLKNRIIMAPMLVGFGNMDGSVSETTLDYYEARARGGAGLIIVEATCVDSPAGSEGSGQLCIDSKDYVDGLSKLSAKIKKHGAGAFIQLFHAGRQTSSAVTGEQPVAPSSVPCRIMREIPRELAIGEIEKIEKKFIDAAVNARMAGFDGVELHAAHGYLINQFLSGHSNRRSDIYGGSLENRMRLLVNIIDGIKEVAPELAISVRLNIDDFIQGGLNLEESITICKHLESSGVNLINCSCGTYESGLTSIEPVSYQEGWRIYLAEEVKKNVSIPVVGGGMISNPEFASKIVAEGRCDLVFLGRSLLADPEWSNKARQGKTGDIRPCIRCNNCISSNMKGVSVSCTVNPQTGREKQYNPAATKSSEKHQTVIIGSGPAGMQAAIALDRLGFQVRLFEKENQAGGLMNLACIPPHKERVAEFRDYLIGQIKKSKIETIFEHEFTIKEARDINPDSVVIATGATPILPQIDGASSMGCFHLQDFLNGTIKASGKDIVIIGGGENGCETADFLLQFNNRITIIEKSSYLVPKMEKKNRRDLINRLNKGEVTKKTSCQVQKITNGMVYLTDGQGRQEVIAADAVIMAAGYRSCNDLYVKLKQFTDDIIVIGDALRVRGFKSAVLEGEMAANMINRTVFNSK